MNQIKKRLKTTGLVLFLAFLIARIAPRVFFNIDMTSMSHKGKMWATLIFDRNGQIHDVYMLPVLGACLALLIAGFVIPEDKNS